MILSNKYYSTEFKYYTFQHLEEFTSKLSSDDPFLKFLQQHDRH